MYHFDYRRESGCEIFPEIWGVPHSSELQFVFDNPSYKCKKFDTKSSKLGYSMRTLWKNAAKYGYPDITYKKNIWPDWTEKNDENILFSKQGELLLEYGRRKEYCDFWENVFLARTEYI